MDYGEGTIISNIATGEKMAELPYKYANYVMDPTGNFLIVHSWSDGHAVLKKSYTSTTEKTYPVSKAWTITFSSAVDAKTLTDGSINVVNEKGESVAIQKEIDGNKIIVHPLGEYTSGKYTLHIQSDFKNVNGTSLEQGLRKSVLLKINSTENIMLPVVKFGGIFASFNCSIRCWGRVK